MFHPVHNLEQVSGERLGGTSKLGWSNLLLLQDGPRHGSPQSQERLLEGITRTLGTCEYIQTTGSPPAIEMPVSDHPSDPGTSRPPQSTPMAFQEKDRLTNKDFYNATLKVPRMVKYPNL